MLWNRLHKVPQTHDITFLKHEYVCILKHIWPQGFEIKDWELVKIEVTCVCRNDENKTQMKSTNF